VNAFVLTHERTEAASRFVLNDFMTDTLIVIQHKYFNFFVYADLTE
jgi:hypothetical protein